MWQAKTVFRQMQARVPRAAFQAAVRAHRGDWHVQAVDCWSHFHCLLWAHLSGCTSLREIEVEADAQGPLPEIQSAKRSTVARANRRRPWQVAAAVCDQLHDACVRRHGPRFRCPHPLYSIDGTVVDLCQQLFPWAPFRKHKAGLKAHVLWDHRHGLPTLLNVTPAREREFQTARRLSLPPGSLLCCDGGYIDFALFHDLRQRGIHVFTRPHANWTYVVVERRPCRDQKNVTSDQIVRLTGPHSRQKYPGLLRRVRAIDAQTQHPWVVLTTDLELPAATVIALYHRRWEIEEFFRFLKRTLHIKAFWGTSYNAVMWQLFTAFALYLLLVYLQGTYDWNGSLFELRRWLRAYAATPISLRRLLAVKARTAT
jgi:hypothetical protein